MLISIIFRLLPSTCLIVGLNLFAFDEVEAVSIGHDFNHHGTQVVSQEILQIQRYPLKFPGYLFVPLAPQKRHDSFKAPSLTAKIPSQEEAFQEIDEDVANAFIDEFLIERFLDLMKEEIATHYASDSFEGKTTFLPFEVDSLTNYDVERGLSAYDNEDDKRYRICDSCAPGYPGPRGNPGISGVPGLLGDKGNLGPRGNSGDQGTKGIKGVKQKGVRGDKGFKGRKGELGDPGSKGLKGVSVKGNKGIRTMGPKGYNAVGAKGSKGHFQLCCDPGLFDPNSGLCYFHIEEEFSYDDAVSACTDLIPGAAVVDFTSGSTSVSDIDSWTNFLDSTGTNIWSNIGGGPLCIVWDFATGSPSMTPCSFPNDVLCQYSSLICPPSPWL